MLIELQKKQIIDLIYKVLKPGVVDIVNNQNIDLIKDLYMDSITFVSLVIEIESFFEIIFPDEVLNVEEFRTFNNIISNVEKAMKKKSNTI